jgi:hypothetical protein
MSGFKADNEIGTGNEGRPSLLSAALMTQGFALGL